ncbi:MULTISPECIES: type II and III secretion system protein family protein [Pseudomonas]|nr:MULTISPECIES: type II and III secretion system protein family protein [Pseudomonas]AJO80212.1 secretin [Pseudomonas sp. MRSN 12121]
MNSNCVRAFRRVAWALIVSGLPAGIAIAAPNNCTGLQPLPATVEVGEGQQTLMHSSVPITRLAVGDPKVADVYLNGRDSYLLTGIAPGATSLMVWTACDQKPRESVVFVQGKGPHSMVSSLLPPSEDPALASQVQTDIRFVEVSRSKLKEAGTSIFGKSGNFLFSSPGTVPGLRVTPGNIGGVTANLPLNNGTFNIGFGGGNVLGLINALEGSGFAYTLARPSLVALSGQSASFLAGGEVPIPVPSSGSDSITIQYKEFGIRLTLTPTIVGSDRIALKVAPEVSELDFTNGISVNGITVPALIVRRTDTSISLADGESFVISGLISTTNTTAVSKFPGLGEIPILGAFFRDSSIRREEKELLMIVTPHLVQPLAVNAKLPTLPGEPLRNYDPNWFRLYFLENGDFDQASSGLSQ